MCLGCALSFGRFQEVLYFQDRGSYIFGLEVFFLEDRILCLSFFFFQESLCSCVGDVVIGKLGSRF